MGPGPTKVLSDGIPLFSLPLLSVLSISSKYTLCLKELASEIRKVSHGSYYVRVDGV